MAENNLTTPLSPTLGGLQQLQGQAGMQGQNMSNPLGGLVGPGNISAVYQTQPWVDTSQTSIPIEIYDRNTGKTVKTYNNLIDYQIDTMVVSGGAESKPSLSPSDIVPAALSSIGSAALIGSSFNGTVGAVAGGLIGAVNLIGNIGQSMSEAYRNFDNDPNRTIELLAEETTDENTGKKSIKLNVDKAAKGNSLSGQYVQDLQGREDPSAAWDETGTKLTFNVSPAFAASDTYNEYVKQLAQDLYGLTKENDTNGEYLQQINNDLKDREATFYYDRQQVASYQAQFPEASLDAIDMGIGNQMAGYFSKEDYLQDYTMQVYDKENQLVEKKASEVLDEIYNLGDDKVAKDTYMGELFAAIEDPTISQDSKAIIQGQIRAIQGANINKNYKYSGMLQKEWTDYLGQNALVLGLSINDVASLVSGGQAYGELKYFSDNDTAKLLVGSASAAINMFTTMKAMNGVESAAKWLGKKGAEALGRLGNQAFGHGNRLTSATEWFINATNNTGAISAMASTTRSEMGAKAAVLGLDLGYQAIADLAVDAGKVGIQSLAGKNVDLWHEFQQDFAMDLIFTYAHTGALQSALSQAGLNKFSVADLQRVIRDNADVKLDSDTNTKTITLHFEQRGDVNLKVDAEPKAESGWSEVPGLTYKELSQALTSAYYAVNNEASMRAAQMVTKIAENKVALKVYRGLIDSQIDIKLLGYQRLAETGDYTDLVKLSNMANSNRVYAEVSQDFFSTKEGRSAYNAYTKAANDFVEKTGKKNLSSADIGYLNAQQSLMRTGVNYGKNSEEYRRAEGFYGKYINGVSETDRLALDQYAVVLSRFASAVTKFEQDNGMETTNFYEQIQKYPGYFPMYAKVQTDGPSRAVEYRETHRSTEHDDVRIAPDAMDDPVSSVIRYLNNVLANVTRARQVQAVIDVAQKLQGIEVTRDKNGAQDFENLPLADVLSRYNVPKTVQTQLSKLADDPTKYASEIDGILAKNQIEQHIKDYSAAKAQLEKNVSSRRYHTVDGDPLLSTSRGAYKKGMTREEVDEQFLDTMEIAVTGLVQGAKQRSAKFKKYYSLDTPAKTVDRIMQEVRENLDAYDGVTLMNRMAQEVMNLTPMVSYEQLINYWVPRNSLERQEEVLGDPEVLSGRAGYSITTGNKVKRRGSPVNIYTDGRIDRVYLSGLTKADQEKADAVVEVLNAQLTAPVKNAFLRVLSNVAMRTARLKRNNVSGALPQRALPNKIRDTQQAAIAVGASAIMSPRKVFADLITPDLYSREQMNEIYAVLDRVAEATRGYTENQVINELRYGTQASALRLANAPDAPGTQQQFEARPAVRTANQTKYVFDTITYNLKQTGKGGLTNVLMLPGDIAEAHTRTTVGQNVLMLELLQRQQMGEDFQTALTHAYERATWASRKATTDFSTKGTLTSWMAKWTPFSYSNFSDIASKVESFVMDPTGFSTRMVSYIAAYVMNLGMTLADEDSRRRYMNASQYEREHNTIISLGNGQALFIPMDEGMASILSPFRTFTEILVTKEPATFWKIFGSFLDTLPVDLSGFTENDQFNLARGMEVLISSQAPALVSTGLELATGRNFYYGTDLSITDEDLAVYGEAADSAGDYTTQGNNSKTLRWLADLTNFPQWRIQQAVSLFTGRLGEYVVNTLDKLQGATADEQGGTDVAEAFYKPFIGTQNGASSAFYDGLSILQEEKLNVQQRLFANEKKQSVATGSELTQLKVEHQEILDKFALRAADFVNQYLQVYELTGGLTDSQARQIYYLFDFESTYNGTGFSEGTAGSSAADKLSTQYKVNATKLAGTALAGNYTPTNLYQKADGTYERSTGYGTQGLERLLANASKEYVAGLEKIGSENNLSRKKQVVTDKRNAIYNKGKLTSADYAQLDKLALDWDVEVMKAFWPYMQKYGTDMLTRSAVIDYLDDYFIVTSDWEVDKRGRRISAPNLNKQRGFAQSFIQKIAKNLGGK